MSNSVVRKYTLKPVGEFTELTLPAGAKMLSFGQQGNALVVWACVDPYQAASIKARALVLGTGWDFSDIPAEFLGTVQVKNEISGQVVWHCFYDFLETSA